MFKNLQNYYNSPIIRSLIFIALLWAVLHLIVDSGVFGGRYKINPYTEALNAYVERAMLLFSIPLFILAILINPFYNFWTKRSLLGSNLEDLTGLHEYHWNQAKVLISKHGSESLIILSLRETDDFLSDNQRKDIQRSRLAAETYLTAMEIENKPYKKTVVHIKNSKVKTSTNTGEQ